MRENRASHLVGWKTHPTIFPRPGIELTTFRTPWLQTCPTPLLTRPRRRLFVMYMDLLIKKYIKTTQKMTLYLHIQTALRKRQPLLKTTRTYDKMEWVFNRYNLKLNLKKTEVLVVSRTEKEAVVPLYGYQLNLVTKFKYPGSIIGSKGHVEEEINGRISLMNQNVGMMYRLLKDRHVLKKAKLLIYMTILRPILL